MNHTESRLPAHLEGEVIEARGKLIVIKAASASQFVCEYTAPPHFAGPSLRVHPGFDESFPVAEGRARGESRRELIELRPGESVYVSGSTPHTFSNSGAGPVRFVLVCSPGGWEHSSVVLLRTMAA